MFVIVDNKLSREVQVGRKQDDLLSQDQYTQADNAVIINEQTKEELFPEEHLSSMK